MTSNKELYREFCRSERELPIFLQDWWLDAVCHEGVWDAAITGEGNDIHGVMPYYLVKGRLGHRFITMPRLTQVMGPWLRYPPQQKSWSRLAFEKKAMNALIGQLPPFDQLSLSFHYSLKNWLPFYWEGFSQSSGVTYVIDDIADIGVVYGNFRGNIRREIKKAAKTVTVTPEEDIDSFYEIVFKTYRRQGMEPSVSLEFLKRLDDACRARDRRLIFFARDKNNRVHAALYVVWDDVSAYHLLSGGDPELRNSGATSLLMWEAIQWAATNGLRFDFEGSMREPIEQFFRSFGAVPRNYFFISKTNSRFLKLKQFLQEIR